MLLNILLAGLDIGLFVLVFLIFVSFLSVFRVWAVGLAESERPLPGARLGELGVVCCSAGVRASRLSWVCSGVGDTLLQLGMLLQLWCLELLAVRCWTPVSIIRGRLLLQSTASEAGAVTFKAIVHVDVVEVLVDVLLVLLVRKLLLFSQILPDFSEHLRLFTLNLLLLRLHFSLSILDFRLFEHLCLVFYLLDLFFHFHGLLLVLCGVNVFVGMLDLGYLLEFDLGHVFVDLLELGLVVFLESVLLLLDGHPCLLDSLLEFLFEFLQLVLYQEGRRF